MTLLLLAGSPAQKMVALVEQRGISFKMNPDLAKKFHDAGASDDLIEALTKAGLKAKDAASGPAASAPAPPPPPASALHQCTRCQLQCGGGGSESRGDIKQP